jgi:V8-like Glu-specific endopeptidase
MKPIWYLRFLSFAGILILSACAIPETKKPTKFEPLEPMPKVISSAPGTINYHPDVMISVAKALAEKGYYDPRIKPVYGLAMQSALRRFQKKQGLSVSGEIDQATLKALKLEIAPEKLFMMQRDVAARAKPIGATPRLPLDIYVKGPFKKGVAWEQVIELKEAASVRLYFQEIKLRQGQILEVRDGKGEIVARYTKSVASPFWTDYFAPLPLTIALRDNKGGADGQVRVTRAQIKLKTVEPEKPPRQKSETVESEIDGWDATSIGDYSVGSEIYQRGTSVAVLRDAGGEYCTGFLIGPNRLMTNNHCIATQAECDVSLARFNYQNDASGNPLVTTDYACRTLLKTNYDLDYSVVELDGFPGYQWGYLRLTWDNVYDPEELTIIQHPQGRPKEVARNNCHVEAVVDDGRGTDTDLGYSCDTEHGSSGSPVFDLRHYEVISLHHYGVSGGRDYNRGVRMRRILADCDVCAQPFAAPGKSFDIDNDGKDDAYVRSPNWAGVIRATNTGLTQSWIKGDWVGNWNLGTDNWDVTGDVDGDGDGDVIIRSPEWLGIFKGAGTGLSFHWIKHDWVGNWNLGFDDRAEAGDLNGDGKTDLVLRSDEWIGLLISDGNKLNNVWLTHDWLGHWNLGRPDRIWVGDFTGDGKDDVFVRSPEWAGLFKSHGDRLEEIWMSHDWLGSWNMGDGDEHYVGDFNGDGKDDLMTRSNEWISLWISNGSGFDIAWIQYDWVGNWNLGWVDWHHIADFNGDGKDDVLIRSNEWIGLLISDGSALSNVWLKHDWLGQWNLGLPDRERVGDYTGDGKADVMVRSPEWIGRFVSTGTSLTQDFIQHDWLGSWNLGEVDRLSGGR